METKPVLIVDDEADIAELVSYNLKREGFSVDLAADGEAALQKLKKNPYLLVVLDLMLPGLQGLELCRIIRKDPGISSLPIIMLTAKGEEVDRVLGLEIGADDYMAKPFSPRELVARVRAVLRRAREEAGEEKVVSVGGLLINKETYSVLKDGRQLALSSTEFRLLLYLAERKGKVFSRDQLLDAVWKNEAFVEPRTVDVHIRRLRAQIEDEPSRPEFIKTKRGIGYYMDAGL